MAITDWPADDRPREKLLLKGPCALSDAELLAIFLRIGVAGKSAVDLARELLSKFGSLSNLFAAGEKEFCEVLGLGPAKFAQMKAVLEMARRGLQEELVTGDVLSSPKVVRDFLRLLLHGREEEIFVVIFVDAQNRVIASEELFRGTLTQASVYPREVIKRALHFNAASVIFAHNHPSGLAKPSHADESLTEILKRALMLVDMKVLDHFIVAGSAIMSFAEQGLL
ncbi:MAG: DNA repair protein RadC [Pseudomonadota bacterium]